MLRLRSAEPPFDDAAVAGQAARLLVLAEATGAWTPTRIATVLDAALVHEALAALAAVGVGAAAAFELAAWAHKPPETFASWLASLRHALQASPVPDTELPRLDALFGTDRLAQLIDVGASSLRRYLAHQRPVPDAVAERAHVLARIVGELAGTYNERGIRRWFDRPRHQLGEQTPAEVLARCQRHDPTDAGDVLALAAAQPAG